MDLSPDFPEGYKAELTDEHDGTGGVMVRLLSPEGKEIERVHGGGWDSGPMFRLAHFARAYDKGRKDLIAAILNADLHGAP